MFDIVPRQRQTSFALTLFPERLLIFGGPAVLGAPSVLTDVSLGRQPCKGRGCAAPVMGGWGTGVVLGELQTPEVPKFSGHQPGAAIAASNLLLLWVGSGMERCPLSPLVKYLHFREGKKKVFFAECGLCPALLFAMLSIPEKIILAPVSPPACRFGTLAWMLLASLWGAPRAPDSS